MRVNQPADDGDIPIDLWANLRPSPTELLEADYNRAHAIIDDLRYPATETRETMCLSDRLIMLTTQPKRATNPTRDERTTIDLCDSYLSTLHVGSWGRMFYITSDEGRRDAARWLAGQIEGVMNNVRQSNTRGE